MQYQEADTVSVTSSHAFRTSAQHEPRTTSRGKVRTVEHPQQHALQLSSTRTLLPTIRPERACANLPTTSSSLSLHNNRLRCRVL